MLTCEYEYHTKQRHLCFSLNWYVSIEESKRNQTKQLRIKVPKEVIRAAHLILLDDISSSLINKIIKDPKRGKKIVTLRSGHSNISIIYKPGKNYY